MKLRGFSCFLISLFLFSNLQAQRNFHLQVGMNLGASRLFHNTNFETSKLVPLYKTIEATHKEGYSWDQFKADFGLRDAYNQPRMGFSGTLTYRNWPVAVTGEMMSSTSSYTKMAYSVTLELGKAFFLGDSDFQLSAYGGYQFVKDLGFGSETLVNSIGDKEIRGLVSEYFDPVKPLGPQTAQMFHLRAGVGQTFGIDDQLSVGLEMYGALDMTDRATRQARMNCVGIQAYARFLFDFGFRRNFDDRFYPNPNGK
ncbi:MAG: hypothetical protein KGS48_17500 [Bacteroidetes bacterium]|nr:hypothetical protein [Bacteroidota bacterium]